MAPQGVLSGRSLYLCTPDRPDLSDFLAAVLAGGVDIVQLRDKHLEVRDLLLRADIVRARCEEASVPFVMNDRPDLALAAGADGVHVGQADISPSICRSILGEGAIIGLSTHHPDELSLAVDEPIDYFAVGPVTETPTKPGRAGTGIGYVEAATEAQEKWAAAGRPMPYFVTGGVTPEHIAGLVAAGARGFVVVRYLTEASDPYAAATALRRAIDEAVTN